MTLNAGGQLLVQIGVKPPPTFRGHDLQRTAFKTKQLLQQMGALQQQQSLLITSLTRRQAPEPFHERIPAAADQGSGYPGHGGLNDLDQGQKLLCFRTFRPLCTERSSPLRSMP